MGQIIVLNEGRIVESGAFQELLKRREVFAGMAAGQEIFAPTARLLAHAQIDPAPFNVFGHR
jgi:hypothetical protein